MKRSKYKYRFKTYEELKSGYYKNFGFEGSYISIMGHHGINTTHDMDYLFGEDIKIPKHVDTTTDNFMFSIPLRNGCAIPGRSSWGITSGMLVKVLAYPQYNKRKLVY